MAAQYNFDEDDPMNDTMRDPNIMKAIQESYKYR